LETTNFLFWRRGLKAGPGPAGRPRQKAAWVTGWARVTHRQNELKNYLGGFLELSKTPAMVGLSVRLRQVCFPPQPRRIGARRRTPPPIRPGLAHTRRRQFFSAGWNSRRLPSYPVKPWQLPEQNRQIIDFIGF
jgi:hypothetical protein